jgi:hypothetical protein
MKKKLRLICRLEIHRPRPVGDHKNRPGGTFLKKWFCPLCGQSWYSEKKYFGVKQYTYSGVSNPPNISKDSTTELIGFPMSASGVTFFTNRNYSAWSHHFHPDSCSVGNNGTVGNY